jgi:hypothetical protein
MLTILKGYFNGDDFHFGDFLWGVGMMASISGIILMLERFV